MDNNTGSGRNSKEVFEFLSMDKKITEKEIENYLRDSTKNKNKKFRKNYL